MITDVDFPVVLATTALEPGGVWRHIEDLAGELRGLGHNVSIGIRANAQELRERALAEGLPVESFAETIHRRRCIWHGHLHNTFDRTFAAAAVVRRAIGPTVLTEHNPHCDASDPALGPGHRHPLAGPAKTVFKRVELAATDAVIAVGPSSVAFMRKRYGACPRMVVVTNGLRPAPEVQKPPPPHDGPIHVVSIGAVTVEKGHDVLLEAAALSRGGWVAEVLGEGVHRERLARLAAERNLPVNFRGWVEDVQAAILQADVACMPSRWEAAPYSALEAMRDGLPLVGSDVDGLRDVIEHGVSGLLVSSEDPQALANALDELAADPDLRRRIGEAAKHRAALFTVARMAQETLEVYRSVISRRSRSRS